MLLQKATILSFKTRNLLEVLEVLEILEVNKVLLLRLV